MNRFSGVDQGGGGAAGQRALIIHGDDLGMSHSINQASFAALEEGAITSASVMAPCPWLLEVAKFVERHPQTDIGLHLTLTSECPSYRWRPLSSTASQQGLTDSSGFFPEDVHSLRDRAPDIRAEVHSQLNALAMCGITPTHIDSHMMAAFCSNSMIKSYVSAVREAEMMAFVPAKARAEAIRFLPSLEGMMPSMNAIHIKPTTLPHQWLDFYLSAIDNLAEGISILIVHVGFDTDELRAVRGAKVGWDAEWRQRDFDVLTSAKFRQRLESNSIQLTNWRNLQPAIALATSKQDAKSL